MKKFIYLVSFLIAVVLGAGIFALFADISNKKIEEKSYPLMLNKVSDTNPDIQEWGKNFPSQYNGLTAMKDIHFPNKFCRKFAIQQIDSLACSYEIVERLRICG